MSEKEKKETCLFKRELPDGGIRPNWDVFFFNDKKVFTLKDV